MNVFAVVAMGQMGAGIAARLVSRGARVLTCLEGRSTDSAQRAKVAGAEVVDAVTLVEQADILLSVVPPSVAGATAETYRALMAAASAPPVFVDCNAIAAQTLVEIAEPFAAAGLPLVDGSIIGGPPKADGAEPRIYLSGAAGSVAQSLQTFGLNARILSETPGDASALKMSYAGITKGFQALGTAMALGAARGGVSDAFVKELKSSQPEIYAWLSRQLPGTYKKAYRWHGEMREIARFLEPEEGAVQMLNGAAALYEHVAADNHLGPEAEIIATLDAFVGKRG